MKVFISWSGTLSHKVACAFREWLPSVIQSVGPYVSSEDIDKGTRWSTDIAKELEESSYGIICVTKENINAPWISFEAGALSKSIDKANVTPFLFNVKRSEVQGPLLQFQSTIYEKDEVFKTLKSINNRVPEKDRLSEVHLKKTFEVWWPQLKSALDELQSKPEETSETVRKAEKAKPEILEEILELVRRQQRLLNSPEALLPPDYILGLVSKYQPEDEPPGFRSYETVEKIHSLIIDLEQEMFSYDKENSDKNRDLKKFLDKLHEVHTLVHRLQDRSSKKRRDRYQIVEKGKEA